MNAVIALAMLLLEIAPADAQVAKTCGTGPDVVTLNRLADLPDEVRKAVLADGRVADASQPYFTFGTPQSYKLPVRRFVRAGRAGTALYVWVEADMPALLRSEVLGFGYSEGHWYRTSASQGDACVAVQAVVSGVESSFRLNPRPLVYKDQKAEVTFVVGRDGRYVTAIDARGKIIWDVDPFAEGKLDPYRTSHPVISYLGPAPKKLRGVDPTEFISVGYDTSQFGMLRISDGAFTFLGQD